MLAKRSGLYLIVFLLVFGYVGLVFTAKRQPQVQDAPLSYPSEEECEEVTGKECSFVMCDLIPEGKTFEEVCGRGFTEGWQPQQLSS
ncbi:MAG TPA: hypothetical protein VJB10_01385 [Candidatus Peribacteraceae bacterium]|nr:hypothetical protein [Candidatus Peribacteraceae bacterium]